jgi:hypothetical protein
MSAVRRAADRRTAIDGGEPFEIAKAEIRNGNQRWIEWQVRRIEEPQQPVESGNFPAAAASESGLPQNHRNGSTNGPLDRALL